MELIGSFRLLLLILNKLINYKLHRPDNSATIPTRSESHPEAPLPLTLVDFLTTIYKATVSYKRTVVFELALRYLELGLDYVLRITNPPTEKSCNKTWEGLSQITYLPHIIGTLNVCSPKPLDSVVTCKLRYDRRYFSHRRCKHASE